MRVRQVLAKRADQILAPVQLSFPRYEVLVRLYFGNGELPLSHLGKQLELHQTSVTSLIDKLEAQGLAERSPHPTDRRSTIARITPTGRALLRKAIELLNSELFRDLGLTSEEARTLIMAHEDAALLGRRRRGCPGGRVRDLEIIKHNDLTS